MIQFLEFVNKLEHNETLAVRKSDAGLVLMVHRRWNHDGETYGEVTIPWLSMIKKYQSSVEHLLNTEFDRALQLARNRDTVAGVMADAHRRRKNP